MPEGPESCTGVVAVMLAGATFGAAAGVAKDNDRNRGDMSRARCESLAGKSIGGATLGSAQVVPATATAAARPAWRWRASC